MQPLMPAIMDDDPVKMAEIVEDLCKVFPGLTPEEVRRQLEEERTVERFINDTYQVTKRPAQEGVLWLSVKRLDKEPIHDWRDMQEIKNQLVGPENEGLEVLPAESRLVDTANQYHLWVFEDPTYRLPFGFFSGRAVTSLSTRHDKQRPFPEDKSRTILNKDQVWALRTPLPEPEPPTPDPPGQFCVTRDMTKRKHR